MLPYIPMEGYMALRKLNNNKVFIFLKGAAELKKYVYIDLRKQIRQKMEGFSASQL